MEICYCPPPSSSAHPGMSIVVVLFGELPDDRDFPIVVAYFDPASIWLLWFYCAMKLRTMCTVLVGHCSVPTCCCHLCLSSLMSLSL